MHFYGMTYATPMPGEELPAGRPQRTSPLYETLRAKGGVFTETFGWERPKWYSLDGREEDYSWRRNNVFDVVRDECMAVRERVGLLSTRLANNIAGIATIKSFTREQEELERLAEDSNAYVEANRKAIRISSAFIPIIRMAIMAGFVATLVYGGKLVLDGELNAGAYSVLVFLTQRLLWPLTRMAETVDLFDRIERDIGELEVVVFNIGANGQVIIGGLTGEEVIFDGAFPGVSGDDAVADGREAEEAAGLYDKVRKADVPKQRVVEATRGAILARQPGGIELLVEQLQSDDKVMFSLGLSTARELPGGQVTAALATELAKASSHRQAMLLLALADRTDEAVVPALLDDVAFVHHQDVDVRGMAYNLLGQ